MVAEDQIKKAAEVILNSSMVVVLTGAGISTESGIPDFRSPDTGLWERIDPMEALSTRVLYQNPQKFYSSGFGMLTSMIGAQPNSAHYVLAEMEKEGLINAIITQNIDNLHQKAGSVNIMEVHGDIRTGYCMECGDKVEMGIMMKKVDKGEIPPRCDTCRGILRPSVIFFGDMLPPCFERAWDYVLKCDLLLVVGSSLNVGPVNNLASICSKLMIINMGNTPYDKRAELVMRGKAGQVLDQIYDKILRIKES